jgi:DNA-binding NtrC family response regulator
LAAAGEIQERCPTPLVMLMVYSEPQTIIRAVAAGAGAYLLKPPRAGELQRAMLVAWGRFAALTELRRLNAELQNAHRQLGRLRGLLPICMYCHKIRTEHQSWEAIEQYISKRTEATFTHSICPACARKNFPEIQF